MCVLFKVFKLQSIGFYFLYINMNIGQKLQKAPTKFKSMTSN